MKLEDELKTMIIEELQLPDITVEEVADDALLFGEGLGLDSLDAVELTVLLKKRYQINIQNRNEAREIFVSITSLANYIRENRS